LTFAATVWVFYNFQIQNRIISSETIRRNRVSLFLLKNITQQNNFLTIFYLVDFFRICTQEPGSVLRNLYVLYLWIVDLSSGTVVILLKPVLGTLKFMYWGFWVQIIEKSTSFLFFPHKCPNSYDYNNSWCFNNLSYLMDHRIGIWAQKDWL
jgi:hypothetical protein